MNLRQKAKRFKKLYEDMLPKKPYPVIYETLGAKHYRAQKVVDEREIFCTQQVPELLNAHIINEILGELRPVIWDNLKVENNLQTGKVIYSLDIWM